MLVAACATAACFRPAYYAALERVGKHKRDILVDRVRAGQEAQREAEQQFLTTLDAFKQVTGFDGGDLEDVYRSLDREFQRSEARAERVSERIDSIDEVAEDLFAEWEREAEEISDRQLRARSRQSLRDTRGHYERLVAAMRRAEARMDPVLVAFRDQVLFLKHNLNAQAIASLRGSVVEIENDVERLIREMQESIRTAETFLSRMEGGGSGGSGSRTGRDPGTT